MTRFEILDRLDKLQFTVIWPDHPYDDLIGFTEREIWVSRKGWGGYACDELNPVFIEMGPLKMQKWKAIRSKLESGSLTYSDIKGTSLELLDECTSYDAEDTDYEWLNSTLKGLLNMPDVTEHIFYCTTCGDEYVFLQDYDKAISYYERTDTFENWSDLTDEELQKWLQLLEKEENVVFKD